MNTFEHGLARYLDKDFLTFLRSVKIGIIGAGGLGSNCAVHLIRCGFANLVLADADVVEPSNLNRQHFVLTQVGSPKVLALQGNLLAINPEARITGHHLYVNAQNMSALFGSCDAVVEAVDDPRTKKLIVETMAGSVRLVIGACGIGGFGRAGSMTVRTVRPGLIIVGDHETPCNISNPPLSPCVGMAAAMQADLVLSHFHTLYKDRT